MFEFFGKNVGLFLKEYRALVIKNGPLLRPHVNTWLFMAFIWLYLYICIFFTGMALCSLMGPTNISEIQPRDAVICFVINITHMDDERTHTYTHMQILKHINVDTHTHIHTRTRIHIHKFSRLKF